MTRRTNIPKASIKMSVHIGKQMVDDESSENRLQNVSQSEIGNRAASHLMQSRNRICVHGAQEIRVFAVGQVEYKMFG